MRKNGFTLAEVLITLTIIGVVASLTMPALMNNANEQQYKTGLKKVTNTLANVVDMSSLAGYNFSNLLTADEQITGEYENGINVNLYHMMTTYAKVDTNESKVGATGAMGTGNMVIFFNDGSSLEYNKTGSNAAASGIKAVLDMNGKKGPNQLSNCNGQPYAAGNTSATDGGDCSVKANRMIKDKFSVLLNGTTVTPFGKAAHWAFNN